MKITRELSNEIFKNSENIFEYRVNNKLTYPDLFRVLFWLKEKYNSYLYSSPILLGNNIENTIWETDIIDLNISNTIEEYISQIDSEILDTNQEYSSFSKSSESSIYKLIDILKWKDILLSGYKSLGYETSYLLTPDINPDIKFRKFCDRLYRNGFTRTTDNISENSEFPNLPEIQEWFFEKKQILIQPKTFIRTNKIYWESDYIKLDDIESIRYHCFNKNKLNQNKVFDSYYLSFLYSVIKLLENE